MCGIFSPTHLEVVSIVGEHRIPNSVSSKPRNMSHYETMSERICYDIRQIISSSAVGVQIENFSILTEGSIYNKSPVVLLSENKHLRLEAWSVNIVYQYACSQIFLLRRKWETHTISLPELENLDCCLMAAILINPYVTTFWNIRRILLGQAGLPIKVEQEFSRIVLQSNFKSSEAFSYRRWTLERSVYILHSDCETATAAFWSELELCGTILESAPYNYDCWVHRQWCVCKFGNKLPLRMILPREFDFIDNWINGHAKVSNGYHYKQFLINFINKKFYPFLRFGYTNTFTNAMLVWESTFLVNETINMEKFWEQFGSRKIDNFATTFTVWVRILCHEFFNEANYSQFYMHENFWLQRRFILYALLDIVHISLRGKGLGGLDVHRVEIDAKSHLLVSNILFTVCKSYYQIKKPRFRNPGRIKIINSPFYGALINGEKCFVKKYMFPSNHKLIRRHISWIKYFLQFDAEISIDPY